MRHRTFALFMLVLAPASAWADSWALPTTEVTTSADGRARVTLIPRPLDSQLAYFEDKVDHDEPAGQATGAAQRSPIGRVERQAADGTWELVWQRPLVNDVGPTHALIANDASHVVTFDNWHSAGYGDDVVVIYDAQGELVRKLAIEEILPPAYVPQLPRSVSSRWWGGEHVLVDNDTFVELRIVQPMTLEAEREDEDEEEVFVPVRVRLADGAVVPPSGAAWERALAIATERETWRLDAWNALRQVRASPLSPPASRDTDTWRRYMFEVRDRIAADAPMGGMVLAAPGEDPGYFDADDIRAEIELHDDEREYDRNHIFVSPTSDRLAALLVDALRTRADGSMKNAHLVFVGTRAEGEQVRRAAAHTGAKITVVDRDTPLPAGEPLPETPHDLWMPD